MARLAVAAGVFCLVAGGEVALSAYVGLSRDLPTIPPFSRIRFGSVSTVRAAHGQVLGERFVERRYLLPRESIPAVLVNAFVASEDRRFFEHGGVDVYGVMRALWANLRAGRVREGASTITQQLARTLLLSNEQTFARKVREAAVARRIEDIYTKDQILLLYLNLIYLGSRYYGVQAASLGYFGKDVSELTVAEAASISASAQTPHRVNPLHNVDELRRRRDRVIRRMLDAGFIDTGAAERALASEVKTVDRKDNLGDRAPVVAMEMMSLIASIEGGDEGKGLLESRGGVTVESTIDLGLQRAAQKAAWDAAAALSRRQGYRGPLAKLPRERWDVFLARNSEWLEAAGRADGAREGVLYLGLVTDTSKRSAEVRVTEGISGTIPLSNMKWAVPYTEFKVDSRTGKRRRRGRVSLDGKLRSVKSALAPGDVVLVSRGDPPRKRKRREDDSGESVTWFALEQFPGPQAALMSVEPRSGYVLALAGGTDFDLSQFDRTTSIRQIGSAVKPIYYSKAYDMGTPPSTVVSGVPFREGEWTPTRGRDVEDMTLFQALTRSENNVSLRVFKTVLDRVGADGLNDWARRLGISGRFEGYPAEGLGIDASPRELLHVYATFANGGIRPDFTFIGTVRDSQGRILRDHRSSRDPTVALWDTMAREVARGPDAARRSITAEVAWIISANLRRVVDYGTGKRAKKLKRPVCGKTGTLPYDVWFVGWTPELATVSWVGDDLRKRYLGRSRVSGRVYGSDTALPPWVAFMHTATDGLPVVDDLEEPPEGIVEVMIDTRTGLLAREGGLAIPHIEGTEPVESAPLIRAQPEEMELAGF